VKKILVIQLGDQAEVLLTTPLVRLLKTQLESEIHCLARHQEIFSENPYLDKFHQLTIPLNRLAASLRRQNFDVVIDLSNSWRTSLLTWIVGASTTLNINDHKLDKWLMTRFKINRLQNIHRAKQIISTAYPLGIKEDTLGLDIFIPDKDQVEMEWLPPEFRSEYVVISLFASYQTRKLPIDKLIELCDRINKPILLIGAENDRGQAAALERFF